MIAVADPGFVCTNKKAVDTPYAAVLSALPSGGSAGIMDIVIHFALGASGPKIQEMASAPIVGHPTFSPSCASFVIKMSVVIPDQDERLCEACRKREVKTVRYSWSPDRRQYVEVAE